MNKQEVKNGQWVKDFEVLFGDVDKKDAIRVFIQDLLLQWDCEKKEKSRVYHREQLQLAIEEIDSKKMDTISSDFLDDMVVMTWDGFFSKSKRSKSL